MFLCHLNKEIYSTRPDWDELKSLNDVPFDSTWIILFSKLRQDERYNKILDTIKLQTHIYPKPEYLFGAFVACPASNLKVVILGQDPYFNEEDGVPQAMGLSFSVPNDFSTPSSLLNIYRNMIKFGHLDQMPSNSNLWFWAVQGCLMLNTALTVKLGIKKSHSHLWRWMTDYMIEYISKYFDDIIFVLWGNDAYEKIELIDQDKHHTIISSHPSGLSAHKPFRDYPAFNDLDHFGEINLRLKKLNKTPIMWK